MNGATGASRAPRSKVDLRPAMILRAAGVLVAACAAIGGVIAVMSGLHGAPDAPNRPAFEVGIAHPAPTSFGTVAVEYAQFLGGPTLAALTGASHNVGALVPPDKMQVEATVTITNSSKSTVRYSPSQFGLLIGSNAKPIVAKRASVGEGTLQPDAGIDVRLTFEADLSNANMTLRYAERDFGAPVLMRLGRHTVTPQRAHGEKPGQILGIGQQFHAGHATADASAASSGSGHTYSGNSP